MGWTPFWNERLGRELRLHLDTASEIFLGNNGNLSLWEAQDEIFLSLLLSWNPQREIGGGLGMSQRSLTASQCWQPFSQLKKLVGIWSSHETEQHRKHQDRFHTIRKKIKMHIKKKGELKRAHKHKGSILYSFLPAFLAQDWSSLLLDFSFPRLGIWVTSCIYPSSSPKLQTRIKPKVRTCCHSSHKGQIQLQAGAEFWGTCYFQRHREQTRQQGPSPHTACVCSARSNGIQLVLQEAPGGRLLGG